MKGKGFLSISDMADEDITSFMAGAVKLKAQGLPALCDGKILAILFEKPSLRTRVSFEVAMRQLGGGAIYISPAEVGLGERESVPDVARVLSRYVDIITARTFSHATVEVLADYATVPVINALSDREHPCQALADFLTIYENKGKLAGLTLAFIGDGNNIAYSLLLAAALVGMNFHIASPVGYSLHDEMLRVAQGYAARSGSEILLTEEPGRAVSGADIVYTDVWASMGQEAESEVRARAFTGYQVDRKLLSQAKADAIFLHDLPAHRGEEVTDDVIDGPQSVVFDQAENRMHAQKALLAKLLGG
ncbi:MAG: ornithine carbamoyltransferase [Dehalococcoidales bacterium]|nr:MAG: ornithine carbamoyltransferase [Dehalococcoidales bacterium]